MQTPPRDLSARYTAELFNETERLVPNSHRSPDRRSKNNIAAALKEDSDVQEEEHSFSYSDIRTVDMKILGQSPSRSVNQLNDALKTQNDNSPFGGQSNLISRIEQMKDTDTSKISNMIDQAATHYLEQLEMLNNLKKQFEVAENQTRQEIEIAKDELITPENEPADMVEEESPDFKTHQVLEEGGPISIEVASPKM